MCATQQAAPKLPHSDVVHINAVNLQPHHVNRSSQLPAVVVPPMRDVFKLPLKLIDVLHSLRLVFGSRATSAAAPVYSSWHSLQWRHAPH